MHSVHDILHATDHVSKKIANAHANGNHGAPALSPKEEAASIIAKNRVGAFRFPT